ncbi:MAG: hypothetical protein WC852_03405 [Candidatus Nanoarchaeia archaeon]|jgi:hypothetical protein
MKKSIFGLAMLALGCAASNNLPSWEMPRNTVIANPPADHPAFSSQELTIEPLYKICGSEARVDMTPYEFDIHCGEYLFLHREDNGCKNSLFRYYTRNNEEWENMWEDSGCDRQVEMFQAWPTYDATDERLHTEEPAGKIQTANFVGISEDMRVEEVSSLWEEWKNSL